MTLLIAVITLPVLVYAGVLEPAALFGTATGDMEKKEKFVLNENPQTLPLLRAAINVDPSLAVGGGDIIVDAGAILSNGGAAEGEESDVAASNNGEISVYIVRDGDTLSQIAEMFDVSAKTVLWANDISDKSLIRPGDLLVILPVTGVRHVVKEGDTLSTIAKKYEGDTDEILAYNQIVSSEDIGVGDTVVIPGGSVSVPKVVTKAVAVKTTGGITYVAGATNFSHPVPGAKRSQGIHGYNGVDLAAPNGTPIRAAAGGTIVVSRGSGWNGGYGLYVVIKHTNGTQTLYAHNSSNIVSVGSSVVTGQVIGYVGSTGRSTGNHVHFEVRGAKNPF